MRRDANVVGQFTANVDGPVHGVTFDGQLVWAATGSQVRAFDP